MLISISEEDPRPIYVQIAADIKEQIRTGDLSPGDELPSVRELADSLDVNLHTVHRAYQKLREQGVIRMRLGQRAKIAPLREAPPDRESVDAELSGRLQELITDAFHLGLSKAEFLKLTRELLGRGGSGGTVT
jgi:GntR family transcriptional regulator